MARMRKPLGYLDALSMLPADPQQQAELKRLTAKNNAARAVLGYALVEAPTAPVTLGRRRRRRRVLTFEPKE